MNGFSLITFFFFALATVFGASTAIDSTNTTNTTFVKMPDFTISSSNFFSASGNAIVPQPAMGYNVVHRPFEVLASSSTSPFGSLPRFFMKGAERTTRPGPFDGSSMFYFRFNVEKKQNNDIKPARPGPLDVNDIFVLFYHKINQASAINSFATLEQDITPGLTRGFVTRVEALSLSSSVKQHLQALGAFLHSALPSMDALLPSSWPSVEVPSWLSSALVGVTNVEVPQWATELVTQLAGSGLLAVYLWAMQDSLPTPQAPAPAPAPVPALRLRRFVSATRRHNAAGQPAGAVFQPAPAPAPAPVPALRLRRFVSATRRHNAAGQPARAVFQPPAPAAVFQPPVVMAQQPAAAAEPTQSPQQSPEQEQDHVEGEVIIYQGSSRYLDEQQHHAWP